MKKLTLALLVVVVAICGGFMGWTQDEDGPLHDRVKHHYADSDGVKIHYVTLGKGPLIVMIHGFPDYWYTWRHQMEELSKKYKVAALDMRGYNRSDKPKGVEKYDLKILVADVAAVIKDAGEEKAIIVGHDWGGAVAWKFAETEPEMTEQLVILNLPHFRGLTRELANNPQQQKNSAYARDFQKEGAHKKLNAVMLGFWVKDREARKFYTEAFKRSDFEGMLNIYKQNYPREPYKEDDSELLKIKAPVLMIHGLKDRYLLAGALNNTWEWLEKDLTLVTIPESGHFVQQDAAERVTRTIKSWLKLQRKK